MYRTTKPCRQLNSQAIKSTALCYIRPLILGKCSVVSAKCISKLTEDGLQKAWNSICKTREACDEAIIGEYFYFSCLLLSRCSLYLLEFLLLCVTFAGIKNVAFFFSAITAQGQSKTRGKKHATAQDDSDSNGEEISTSQVASSASQEWLSNHQTVVDDKLRPTINYWIALTTPNGAPANPIQIHRALLDKGVEITALQVHDFFVTKR